MSASPTTKKRIDDRVRLVQKHENEISEQEDVLSTLYDNMKDIEDEMDDDFDDIYNSPHYKRLWNQLKVNETMAKKTIYKNVYEKQFKLINDKINIANMLLEQAIEKKTKRIKEIKDLLPKKTKGASFRHNTQKKSKSKSPTEKKRSKGGRKKKNKT